MKVAKGRTTIGFEKHIFVCENSREDGHPRGCCKGKGGCEIRILFIKEIQKQKSFVFERKYFLAWDPDAYFDNSKNFYCYR